MSIGKELHAAMIAYATRYQGKRPRVIEVHVSRREELFQAIAADGCRVWFARPDHEGPIRYLGAAIVFSETCPKEGVHPDFAEATTADEALAIYLKKMAARKELRVDISTRER